ncbi:MAG TPA: hypothetical protein VEX15_15610 [Nocardioidaceae bacterium]|nr:hypothetical protein [Nocardioidaceae bacterium]
MATFIEMTQGVEGVGQNAQLHGDGAENQQAQAKRRLAAAEGLNGQLNGNAARALMNSGISQSGIGAGNSKQLADVATRTHGFGHEQAVAQDAATDTGQTAFNSVSSVETTAMSTRLSG